MEEKKTSVPLSWLTECRAISWGLLWWELQSLKRWKQNHLDNLDLMHIHHVTWFKSYTSSANFVQIPPLLQTKHKHNLTINLAQFRTVPCQLLQQLQLQINVTPKTKLGTHQNISSCVWTSKSSEKSCSNIDFPPWFPPIIFSICNSDPMFFVWGVIQKKSSKIQGRVKYELQGNPARPLGISPRCCRKPMLARPRGSTKPSLDRLTFLLGWGSIYGKNIRDGWTKTLGAQSTAVSENVVNTVR